MTCDCQHDARGPVCEQLATAPTPTMYPVDLPVTPKMQDRMRKAGWAPIAETLAAERERIVNAP